MICFLKIHTPYICYATPTWPCIIHIIYSQFSFNSISGFPAMMISGGAGGKVEVISPTGNVSCSLPDMPRPGRARHTMNNNIVCGGGGGTTSCDQLTSAGWTRSHTLQYSRAGHSSWEVEDGIILFGGINSSNTAEIAKWDGTTEELINFLNYDTWYLSFCTCFECIRIL